MSYVRKEELAEGIVPVAGRLHFRIGDIEAATELVKEFHYSHRMAGNIQLVGTWHRDGGLFGDYGPAVAAVVFSVPPTRWSEPVYELSRLVRRDDARISLSSLIGQTCAFLARSKETDLVVSFADWTQGHHGGVYQACSWKYDGARDRAMDGCVINGVFIPGRSLNSKYGTRSPQKLRERLAGQSIEPHYDEGKHLYWRPLSRSGTKKAVRLGLSDCPYPKPAHQLSILDRTACESGSGDEVRSEDRS